MQFFAIQAQKFDTQHDIAEIFLRKVDELGHRCTSLEVLDRLEIGTTSYFRCRADFPELNTVLEAIYGPKRSIVMSGANIGSYKVKVNGREGTVPFTRINTPPRAGSITFRGNSVAHWERQFLKET